MGERFANSVLSSTWVEPGMAVTSPLKPAEGLLQDGTFCKAAAELTCPHPMHPWCWNTNREA